MLKTKDGYAKVIGTSYQGSSDYLLLSNGDSKAISSLSVNYATSAGNADTVDGYHASSLVKFYLSPMANDAPADSAKSWFINTMPSASGAIVYNVPGVEKTIIAGKSSGAHGHMLQLNYQDTYLRVLRYYNGSWKSTDWEKISAGYADSAGSVAWDNVTGKPSSYKPSAHTHTVFKNNLMIKGTNVISDSASIHLGIGDSDTGFKWISDGKCQIYANNSAVGEWTSGGMNWFKNPTVNGNKIWNAGNDGSGSGLDADTVDGVHVSQLCRIYTFNVHNSIIKVGTLTSGQQGHVCKLRFNSGIGYNASNQDKAMTVVIRASNGGANSNGFYFEAHSESYRGGAFTTFYLHQTSKTQCELYMAAFNHSGQSTYEVSFSAGDSWTNEISVQNALPTSNIFTLPNYQIAYTDYNVASATKLATARTIWGQSFDGTGNISGTLSGVSHIQFSADNTYNIGSNSAASKYIYTYWLGSKSGQKLELGANNSGYGQGLCIDTNLNVGIGTNTPAYKLDVKGDIRATGQIIRESSGQTWVNGRRGALLREITSTGYHTLWSLKTTNGSWDFGEYNSSGWNNIPVLSYITDTNFNSSNNTTTYQIKFPLDSGIIALTKNIPTSLKNPYSLTLKANGTTLAIYDGSVSKIVNLTYDNVGAAAKNHTHNSLEPWASYITGDSHATALKSIFDKNKTSIPRNKFISMLSSAYDNTSYYMGYFIKNYDNNPYGGFFVAHYDTAYYIGIANGSFTQHRLVYSTDIPNSLKNPHALTISLNGTSQGPYDGSAAKNINITPSSIGAATSGHNHDNRYLKLTGGTMQLGEGLKFHADDNYFGTNSDARIISLLDGNDKVCDGGLIIDERATLDGKEYVTELLRIRDSEFKWRGADILHSGNYSGILDSRYYTESEVNNLLSKKLNISDFNWTNLPGKLVGNEFNIVNAGFNDRMWFNYLPINDRSKTATITGYSFGNGHQGYATVTASGFVKSGSSSSYVLLGNGDHQTISSLSVNHASFADYICSGTLPTPANNTVKAYKDSLAKFFKDIRPNGGVGANVNVSESIISNWSNDSATYHDSSTYCFIKIGGAYAGATYGQFLLSSYNLSKVGIVGRNSSQWSKIKWLAYEDQIPTDNNQLANGAGYITSAGSCAYANSAGSVAWNSITGKPSSFTPSAHTHSWDSITGKPSSFTPSAHDHNYVLDIGNNVHTTFAYSKPGLSKDSITWLAVWNGYELRAMNKDQIALSGHTHDDRYLKLTGGTMTGTIRFNNLINIDSAIVLDYKYSAGGFARDIVSMKNSVYGDANLGALSILCYPNSTSNGFQYIYLGTDKYDGPNNLRIYKDKVTFGNNILIDAGNIGSQTVANAYHLRINSVNSWSTWHWVGQESQPSWLWGSNDGTNMYVWNPSNFRVAYAASAGNADTLDGIDSTKFLRQVVVPNNTENDFNTFSNMTLTGRADPTTGASLKNAPWSGSGPAGGYGVLTYLFNGYNYGTQMAWEYGSNRIYIRNRHWGGSGVGLVWRTSWDKLALTSDIPSSLKNPYTLTLKANGTTLAIYDGSSAKEANFTYVNVGAASASHTHSNYVTDLGTSGNYLTWTKNGNTSNITVPYAGKTDWLISQGSFSTKEQVDAFFDTVNHSLKVAYIGNKAFPEFSDGLVLAASVPKSYCHQIHMDDNQSVIHHRARNGDGSGWSKWSKLLDSSNYSSYAIPVSASCNKNWSYNGQSDQPTWLWGTNDGTNCYVWNPSNFSVAKSEYSRSLLGRSTSGSDYDTNSSNLVFAEWNTMNDSRWYLKATDYECRVDYANSAGSVSNSLNIFGVSYNGSVAKTVTTSTFVSQLEEGTSTITDGTMFITSVVSNSGFADTNAVNVPYKRKASCLWNYIDNKVSSKYLPLAGGTMNGNARIGHDSGNLYIGNSGNDGWIYTQDIASQSGTNNWAIRTSGAAHFGNVYICTKSNYTTYDSSIIECYNDALYLNYYSSTKVILCKGGGSVGIGTVPSYKLDVNGQAQAEGFRHRSHNSNDSVLLAGGGYSQGVPVKYWSIEQIIINSSEAVYHQNRGGNYTFITKIESYIDGACTLTLQFPSGYDSYNTMIWAMGRTNNLAPSDHANIYATIIYLSGSKYRLVLADDSTLNNGSCQLYFMCF